VSARIARTADDEFAVQFAADAATRTKIIRHLYSGRHAVEIGHIRPIRVAAAIISRLAR
jgi:hypothetical protein